MNLLVWFIVQYIYFPIAASSISAVNLSSINLSFCAHQLKKYDSNQKQEKEKENNLQLSPKILESFCIRPQNYEIIDFVCVANSYFWALYSIYNM